MKRPSLGWACRQGAVLGLAVFIGVGFYGVFHFLFGTAPPPKVTFLLSNGSVPGGSGVGEDRSLTSPLQVGEIQPNCGLSRVCPADHFPVRVYSGRTKDDHPRVCVAGRYVIERDINNGGRGINLVIVDPRWMKAVVARRFDTYAKDSSDLEQFLTREVAAGDILVAVTFDEASRNLSPAARNLLADLGSSQIQNLQFRGQWFMVTQRGITGFSPHEALQAARGGVWSPIDESFCVARQLKGRAIMPDPPVLQNPERLRFCEERPDMSDFCSVHHRESPLRPAILTNRHLVGSAMFTTPIVVLATGGGGACAGNGGRSGRGEKSGDTGGEDDGTSGGGVGGVTNSISGGGAGDSGDKKGVTGSGNEKNGGLGGGEGGSGDEKGVTGSGSGVTKGDGGDNGDKNGVTGSRNGVTHDGVGGGSGGGIGKAVNGGVSGDGSGGGDGGVTGKAPNGVSGSGGGSGVGGDDGPLSALSLTLHTLLGQPGVQPKYVLVLYHPQLLPDVPHLCSLFKFTAKPLVLPMSNGSLDYYEVMRAAFEAARTSFPASPFVTIIEGGLLLAPDFLAYTAALLPLLHDPSLLAVSAWNPNGYPSVSTRPDLAYRAEEFPGLAFTIRMTTYTKELKDNMKGCCNSRGWEGWQWDGRWEREVVLPDVSRVLRRPVGCDLQPFTPLVQALFHRLRATNLEMSAPIQNADSLTAHRYEAHLSALLNTSGLILTPDREEVLRCANEKDLTHLSQFNHLFLNATGDRPKVVVLPYREEGSSGFEGMKVLCRCFGLFHDEHSPPRGLHRGLLRFSMKGSQVFLLSNHSPHFTLPPYTTTTTTLTLP